MLKPCGALVKTGAARSQKLRSELTSIEGFPVHLDVCFLLAGIEALERAAFQ